MNDVKPTLVDDRWSIDETAKPAIIFFDGHPISQMADVQFKEFCQALAEAEGGLNRQIQLRLLKGCWSHDLQNYDPSRVQDVVVFLLIEKSVSVCALAREIRGLDYDFAHAASMFAAGIAVNPAIVSASVATKQKVVVAA